MLVVRLDYLLQKSLLVVKQLKVAKLLEESKSLQVLLLSFRQLIKGELQSEWEIVQKAEGNRKQSHTIELQNKYKQLLLVERLPREHREELLGIRIILSLNGF